MKIVILSLFICCIALYSYSQPDNTDCLEKTFQFFTPFDGFYLTDNCKYAEFDSYEFIIDRGSGSIKKEGVYREVWFRKKEDSKRVVSGLQILRNHANAIKTAGGEIVKEYESKAIQKQG